LLTAGLAQAVQVYLSPPVTLAKKLSPKYAGFALSRHLGLDFFETAGDVPNLFDDVNDQTFVARGSSNALLLSMNEVGANDILPPNLKPSFALDSRMAVSSLSSLISTFLHRAPHAYSHIFSEASYPKNGVPRILDIFSVPSPATESFLSEMSTLLSFLEPGNIPSDKFGAFELKGLDAIAESFGRSSEQYKSASQALRAFLQSALANNNIHIALLTYSTSTGMNKRAPQQSPLPAPQLPISSVSTCHLDAEICSNSTNSCSGRGQCVEATKAGRTCFVCACLSTKSDDGKTQDWAGEACERKDISGPFVLIAGTVIGLLIIIVGSVSLLYGVGDEQLPSILTGGVGSLKRD